MNQPRFKIGQKVRIHNKRSIFNGLESNIEEIYLNYDGTFRYYLPLPKFYGSFKKIVRRWFAEQVLVLIDDLPDDGRKDKWI